MICGRSPCFAKVIGCGMAWTIRVRYSRCGESGALPSHRMMRTAPGRVLGREGDERNGEDGERGLVALADEEEVVAALPVEDGLGGAFDGVGRAEPDARCGGLFDGCGGEQILQHRVFPHVGRRVAFEDNRPRIVCACLAGLFGDLDEIGVAFLVRQPDGLEGAVALDGAGGVVVDAFAGSREESRRGVVVIHDQVGVGLVALKGDADDHLAERGAGHGVGAAEGLRTEQHMDAEGAALADDAVEQQRGGLGDFVILDEQFLELVDDEQRAGDGLGAAFALVTGDVLDAELAEHVAAALQFFIEPLEHAEAEFAVALDGDDARVGQAFRAVAFELDALFEVDEVELDLLGTAPEREVGDDDVEEGGFAGTGFAGEQRVLACALADGEVLQLGRAAAADGDAQFAGGFEGPDVLGGRGDVGERHLDAVGVLAALADFLDEGNGELRGGRGVEHEIRAGDEIFRERKLLPARADADAAFAELLGNEILRHGLAPVPVNERVHRTWLRWRRC